MTFVVGDIRHGKPTTGLYRPGDVVSTKAPEGGNMMFFAVCEGTAWFDDEAQAREKRSALKRFGNIAVEISEIVEHDEGMRVAHLLPVEKDIGDMLRVLLSGFEGRVTDWITPPVMTLSPATALAVGDQLNISYVSILEPLGDGRHRLLHDYVLNHYEGPRHEVFREERS